MVRYYLEWWNCDRQREFEYKPSLGGYEANTYHNLRAVYQWRDGWTLCII